jgi:UDP-N-acetylglucosamine 3-dehydrogenase
MKIMQIGTGRWGTNHLRVLSHLPVELYVAEISEAERRKCLAYGIAPDHITDNYMEFIEIVSAVDVVTPAPSHYALCKELLERDKSVFLEKPIAETSAQAEKLAVLASERELVLQVGHIFRFDPATDFIKEYLKGGEMGAVQSLGGMFAGFKRPRADGGVVISDAIHFIDLFNYVLDAVPHKILARCEDLLGRGMDDMSWVWMDYNGIPALVEANYFSPDKKRLITINGDKATLVCDFTSSQDKVKIYRNQHILDHDTWKSVSGEIIHKEISPAEPLFLELKEFIDCVRNRSKPRADARDGVNSMKVVEAAMRSHAEGKAVEL